jgi:hypothetical protein
MRTWLMWFRRSREVLESPSHLDLCSTSEHEGRWFRDANQDCWWRIIDRENSQSFMCHKRGQRFESLIAGKRDFLNK